MRAIKDIYTVTKSITPRAVAGTTTGTSIDTANAVENAIIYNFGLWTDGVHTPSLTYSGDNSTFTAVPAADLVGSFSAVSSTATATADQKVSYIGAYRYLRPVLTAATVTTGMVAGVFALTKIRKMP